MTRAVGRLHEQRRPAFGLEDRAYRLTPQTALIPAIVGRRPIDQLFISLGGNDAGFTTLALWLLAQANA